jgi:hypothetical protein
VQRLLLLAFSLAAFVFITGAYSPDAVNSAENTAKLKNIPSTAAPFIMRMGFAVAGDAPPLVYKSSNAACSLNAGNGDDGSQVKSLDSKCWLAQFADRGRVDIRQFGAKPDNTTDTAVFVKAAFNAGVGVYLPGSIGIWKFTSNQTYSDNRLLLTGDYPAEIQGTGACPTGTPRGTWIHISSTSVSPFNISQGSGGTLQDSWGSDIGNIGICQDHPAPAPGWAPTVYPPVFNLSSAPGCHIHNIYYYGVYDSTNANNSARCTHTDIRGQVFHITWTGDPLYDVTTLTNFHMWNFWSTGTTNQAAVNTWTWANAEMILAYRTDSIFLKNIFGIFMKSCLHLATSPLGYGNPTAIIGDLNCDASKYSIWITASNTYGHQIVGYLSGGDNVGSEAVRIEGTANLMNFPSLYCFYTGLSCIDDITTGGGNVVKVGVATVYGYNRDATGSPAFKLTAGSTSGIDFGVPVTAFYDGGSAPVYSQGGGIISVGGWYTKTYTPTLAFGGASAGMTTSVANGSYTRNIYTNQTHGDVAITLTAKGGSTGPAGISGPPGISALRNGVGSINYYANLVGLPSAPYGLVQSGGLANLQLLTAGATAVALVTDANFSNTSQIQMTFNFN